MGKFVEITITAALPAGGDPEGIGHDAVVAVKDSVGDVAQVLVGLGLKPEVSRRIADRRGQRQKPEPEFVGEAPTPHRMAAE